ncbi:ERF family protein [Lactiplantibacillus daowaiensis]|uniref:ERF family protein n=1 Tax=Lactiplantibacillus daowaiensis TaxID=2559918 RepID=A0ABW1RYQ0_9LACO|nr:ERF family protein [Lactiplantibacillus daowaiensis]
MTEKLNLVQKLNEASKMIGPIGKDGDNKYQHYAFQSETAVKYAVEKAIREVGIRIIPKYEVINQYDHQSNKGGNNHFVDVMGTFTITDGDAEIVGTMPGSGQDTGEKAMVKACTTAQKYFYKQIFNITDKDEDPDADDSNGGQGGWNGQPPVNQGGYQGNQPPQSNGQGGNGNQQQGFYPPTNEQRTTLDGLFKATAKVTGNPIESIKSYYAGTFGVDDSLGNLSHDQANSLIETVTQQLNAVNNQKGSKSA